MALQVFHTHQLSQLLLHFGSPVRQIDSPPWPDALANLGSSQLSVFKSLLITSNVILIPPGVVATKGSQAGYLPNQGLQIMSTIDDDAALNGTRHNSNIPKPESLSAHRALNPLFGVASLGAGILQEFPCFSSSSAKSRTFQG
jgi:hypothetical protein